MVSKEEKIKKIGFEKIGNMVLEKAVNILYEKCIEWERVAALENQANLSRYDKLEIMGLVQHDDILSDGFIDQIYQKYQQIKYNINAINLESNIQLVKKKKKEEVVLKLLNGILLKLDKKKIVNIVDFTGVSRDELIGSVHMETFRNMEKEIYDAFDEFSKQDFQKQPTIKAPILTIIKKLLKDLGYHLDSKKDFKNVNGKKVSYITYYITQ